jgi:HSP20 family molecular chaperone IbpA
MISHAMGSHWKHFMPYELTEEENQYYIEMPLPGFSVEDIEVSVRGKQIAIDANYTGKTPKLDESGSGFPMMNAWLWKRPIHVKIQVSSPIDPEKVSAKLKKGLLQITFQKKEKKSVNIEDQD